MDLMSAVAGVRTTVDIVKTAISTRDEHKVADVEQRLTRVLLDVTTAGLELQQKMQASIDAERSVKERVRELEQQIAELEKWSTERERYALTEISESVFALALKRESQGADPNHYLCQPCMDNRRKKATLQRCVQGLAIYMACPECGYKYPFMRGAARPPGRAIT